MKSTVAWMAMGLLAAGSALAQERSAGQAYDAQTNWAALKGMFDKIDNQNKAIAATLTAISDKLDAIGGCGKQQKLWDGTACVDAAATTQAGSVSRSGNVYNNGPQAVHVTFAKPFAVTPKVTVGLSGFTKGIAGNAGCNAGFAVALSAPTNVTKTGFDVVLTTTGSTSGGHHNEDCVAYGLTNTIMWVATQP